MQSWMKTTVIAVLALTVLAGCRNSRRGVRVGGDAAELKVYMSFPPHNFNVSVFTYELSGCEGIPALTGTPSADGTYATFKAVGLQQGMICQLRVKDLAADSNIISFTGEDKVLYWASQVVIVQDAEGTLKSNLVSLQPLYQIKPQPGIDQFSIKVPVSFDKAPEDKQITAVLTCTPQLINPSSSQEVKGLGGWFAFTFPITSTDEHTCTALRADNGSQLYTGAIAAFKFTPEKDVSLKVDPAVALKLQDNGINNPDTPDTPEDPNTPPPTDDETTEVTVETEAKDCTGDDEYYDVTKRECVKK